MKAHALRKEYAWHLRKSGASINKTSGEMRRMEKLKSEAS